MTDIPFTPQLQLVISNSKNQSYAMNRDGVDIDIFFDSFINNLSLSCTIILEKYNLIDQLIAASSEVLDNKRPSKKVSKYFKKDVLQLFQNCEKTQILFKEDYISGECVLLNLFNSSLRPKAIEQIIGKDEQLILNLIQDATLFCANVDIEPKESENEDFEQEVLLDMFDENPILSEFAENLNLKAANNEFDKIVDFDDKISEISTILCRKKKPNAILVGPAGTGKSSLVEALACKIVQGEAPELIANKVIYSLSLSSMVSGTQFRGQFEERLENFINEIKKYSNVILFIDEIHTLVGAGGAGGSEASLEASNILKPELARGTISCIGATTINEYNKTIKKDSALDRRFERVIIKEPSKFQMEKILPTIFSYYESFHGIKYSDDFINSVLDYCERYLPNKHYPDKAIDVIDHCGAQAKITYWSIDPSIKELQSTIISNIENNLPYEYLMDTMNEKLEEWGRNIQSVTPCVNKDHLKEFFSKKENPLCKMENIKEVNNYLMCNLIGHRKEMHELQNSIISSNFFFPRNKSSPKIYSISGGKSTGKTYFCSLLEEALLKTGSNVLLYNGVHFSDEYGSHKILSDYNKNTSLCERIIIHPNSIIIIDDFHRVHPSAENLFLQIFKEGRLQTNNGDIADFSNCKIFITSEIQENKSMGFNKTCENQENAILNNLNSLLETNIFLHTLTERDMRRVLAIKLNKLKGHLLMNNIELIYDFKFIKKFAASTKNFSDFEHNFELKIHKFIMSQIIGDCKKIDLKNLEKSLD